jgi:hypothetical protein
VDERDRVHHQADAAGGLGLEVLGAAGLGEVHADQPVELDGTLGVSNDDADRFEHVDASL